MAAVALTLEDEPDSLPQGEPRGHTVVPRRGRSGRRQTTRVKHNCHRWHGPEGRAFYATTITRCRIHDGVMLEFGEWGRKYPEPVCYQCLPGHERGCPMGDASVLASWLMGLTCICPDRLRPLGLKIQKVASRSGAGRHAKVWAVGPA
jgi:hypothetical protein